MSVSISCLGALHAFRPVFALRSSCPVVTKKGEMIRAGSNPKAVPLFGLVRLSSKKSLTPSFPATGNVACDEQNGGRLIFYDFGMMDEFAPSVRSGLVNLIFSTYDNDPRAVCDALVEMGILRATADRIRWVMTDHDKRSGLASVLVLAATKAHASRSRLDERNVTTRAISCCGDEAVPDRSGDSLWYMYSLSCNSRDVCGGRFCRYPLRIGFSRILEFVPLSSLALRDFESIIVLYENAPHRPRFGSDAEMSGPPCPLFLSHGDCC